MHSTNPQAIGVLQNATLKRLGKAKSAATWKNGSGCTTWQSGLILVLAWRGPTLAKSTIQSLPIMTKLQHGKLPTKASPSPIITIGMMSICTVTSGRTGSIQWRSAMLIARQKALSWLSSLAFWVSSTSWSVWTRFACSSAHGDTDGESARSTPQESSACSNSVWSSQLVVSCSLSTMVFAQSLWEQPRFGTINSSGLCLMISTWPSLSGSPQSSPCLALFAAATSRSVKKRTWCEHFKTIVNQEF